MKQKKFKTFCGRKTEMRVFVCFTSNSQNPREINMYKFGKQQKIKTESK